MPTEIDNNDLKSYIKYRRNEISFSKDNDDEIELVKGSDYYEFSPALWSFFYHLYGCKDIIMIRYFRNRRSS